MLSYFRRQPGVSYYRLLRLAQTMSAKRERFLANLPRTEKRPRTVTERLRMVKRFEVAAVLSGKSNGST